MWRFRSLLGRGLNGPTDSLFQASTNVRTQERLQVSCSSGYNQARIKVGPQPVG